MPRRRAEPEPEQQPSEQGPISLERMLTDPRAFGLVTATKVQRAICRAADGEDLGELWKSAKVRRAFGGARPKVGAAPTMMVVLAGIRGAKSMKAAAKAICATQNVDVSQCAPGDDIRLPVLSTEVDTAQAIFQHIKGALQASPMLASLMVGEPKADSVKVRHPSGRIIEIKVTAMARAGSTLVGRWLAGCVFDEAPRMMGDGSTKSLNESLRAIRGRILPGGQIWCIGSPHAPFGPAYDLYTAHFGNPGATVVVKAPAPDLNPVWWTKERIAEVKSNDPRAYRTDVLAEFADPEEALISSVALAAVTRSEPLILPPVKRWSYVAAMDPGMRGNAWTLVVLTSSEKDSYRVALHRQWIGDPSAPLSPRAVMAEIAEILKPYRTTEVTTDQYSLEAIRDLGEMSGLLVRGEIIDADNRLELAGTVAHLILDGRLEVPADPVFRADLLAAKRRVTQNAYTLALPQSGDGRHCDYLPALMLCCKRPPDPPWVPPAENPHGLFARTIERLSSPADPYAESARALLR